MNAGGAYHDARCLICGHTYDSGGGRAIHADCLEREQKIRHLLRGGAKTIASHPPWNLPRMEGPFALAFACPCHPPESGHVQVVRIHDQFGAIPSVVCDLDRRTDVTVAAFEAHQELATRVTERILEELGTPDPPVSFYGILSHMVSHAVGRRTVVLPGPIVIPVPVVYASRTT